MSDSSQQTLNIPGLLVVALFSFLAIRWYLSSSGSATTATRSGSRNAASRINPAHVDQLLQMFPQLSRREIMWDLQRNGGNIAATTERVLGGRGLDQVCRHRFRSHRGRYESLAEHPPPDRCLAGISTNTISSIATAFIPTATPNTDRHARPEWTDKTCDKRPNSPNRLDKQIQPFFESKYLRDILT